MTMNFYGIFSTAIILACWSSIDAVKPFQKINKNNPNASLSCILFDDFGCNVECAIVHNLYIHKSTGSCNVNKACLCAVESKPPGTKSLSVKKGLLQDHSFLQSYATTQLNDLFQCDHEVDYARNLLKYLDENQSKAGIQNVFHQIRESSSAALIDILDKFLNEHDVNEKIFQSDDDDLTWQLVTNFIINEMVNRCDPPSANDVESDDDDDVFFDTNEQLIAKYGKYLN